MQAWEADRERLGCGGLSSVQREPSSQLEPRTESKCAWEGPGRAGPGEGGGGGGGGALQREAPLQQPRDLERYSWNKGKHYAGGDRSAGRVTATRT